MVESITQDQKETALLVHVNFSSNEQREDVLEFQELVTSAGIESYGLITSSKSQAEVKYFIGSEICSFLNVFKNGS